MLGPWSGRVALKAVTTLEFHLIVGLIWGPFLLH
jgi:hypothetical protein